MIWSPFGGRRLAAGESSKSTTAAHIEVAWDSECVWFKPEPPLPGWLDSPGALGASSELALLLRQLDEEGFIEATDLSATLSWDNFYKLSRSEDHAGSLELMGLPPCDSWRPSLSSKGSLTDPEFGIGIQSWRDGQGQRPRGNVEIRGAVIASEGKSSLLSESTWRTVKAISEHRSKSAEQRTPDGNRRDWARIRGHALESQADLADFLKKTVVLTPDRLKIEMRKAKVAGETLVEVMPQFEGAPPRWLEMFDRLGEVPDRYDIPDGAGLVQVLMTDEVKTVLREIRRMPGRRVTGDRAEAFVRNPFATLGSAASKVIDPDQFERAREDAGIVFARFNAKIVRDGSGFPVDVGLVVEEVVDGAIRAEVVKFEGQQELDRFLNKLEGRISAGAQCCHWNGYDLEILGDTPGHAQDLREALRQIAEPRRIKASDIFDLSKYSDRVDGFGAEKPYYSPFISKKSDEEGWFPENIDLGLCFTPEGGETVALALDEHNLQSFRDEATKAKDEKRETFSFPGCPKPIPVEWAMDALETLGTVKTDVAKGSFEPRKFESKAKALEKKGLVVKSNVDLLDYEERRGNLSPDEILAPILPTSLLEHIKLKEHQLVGVAWLQRIWRNSPKSCRGALLADDMGLGKTIQLLTFMAAAIESEPDVDPFLVVAPVSLLDNWKLEIEKFFKPGAMEVLTLYGPSLACKRVLKSSLDESLIQAGSPKLLMPGWRGEARVVLTTYETLRDLEFSLAAQRWSAMICDEAQKIKNPNALVTRAAKKQNARLKIACTGTPVENTLTDIWCLFDFVQPGLLGSLKDFGSKYRRPIEAETDEEKARIEELRALIEPQKLRRTKAEVAKDLPQKIEFHGCRALALSQRQRSLYADAIAQFRARSDGQATGLQSPLGLLQYLRRLCSDPRPPGHVSTTEDSIAEIRKISPKMAWMLGHLHEIKKSGEKVIVFCEFRDLQRTLQRAIEDGFGFVPDVINGDTSADSANANNRHRRIEAFQKRAGFGVIVLSPLAVGFGVNIQAANHVIHFTRTWNPAKEDQATDRAYRIGQERDVYVYYPVVVAPDFLTFDAKLDKLLDRKRALSTDMLNGSGDVSPADFGDLEAPDGGNAFGEDPLTSEDIPSLGPDAFEAFCALLWSKQGFTKTVKTARVGDGGVDIVAIHGAKGELIQCKSSGSEGRELGWEAIKDVAAGSSAYAARYPNVRFNLVAATNRRFNQAAREQAQTLHVRLVDGDELARMLEATPTKRGELNRFLMSGWRST